MKDEDGYFDEGVAARFDTTWADLAERAIVDPPRLTGPSASSISSPTRS